RRVCSSPAGTWPTTRRSGRWSNRRSGVVARREVHDRPRALGVLRIEDDVDVVELRLRRIGDDRRFLLLGPALERVAHTEQPGGDHGPGTAAAELVDGALPGLCFGLDD